MSIRQLHPYSQSFDIFSAAYLSRFFRSSFYTFSLSLLLIRLHFPWAMTQLIGGFCCIEARAPHTSRTTFMSHVYSFLFPIVPLVPYVSVRPFTIRLTHVPSQWTRDLSSVQAPHPITLCNTPSYNSKLERDGHCTLTCSFTLLCLTLFSLMDDVSHLLTFIAILPGA